MLNIINQKSMEMKLSEAARKKKNEYQRQYRRRNPEKARKYQIDFWERKAGNDNQQRERRLSEQGMSQREIASELGISLGAVNKYLKSWSVHKMFKGIHSVYTDFCEPK